MCFSRGRRLCSVLIFLALLCCASVLVGCDDEEESSAEVEPQQAEASKDDGAFEDDDDSAQEQEEDEEETDEERAEVVEDSHGVDDEVLEAFGEVATEVRYEPYHGVLRGPAGAESSGSANAADQALLLGEKLKEEGHEIRYARGVLTGGELSAVVESIYPTEVLELKDKWEADEPFEPTSEEALRDAAREHLWVELKWDDEWLALDPVVPDAAVGETFAERDDYFETPPTSLFQKVEFKAYAETVGGDTEELGSLRATAAELAEEPPILAVRPIPLVEEESEAGSQAEAQAMDALSGLGGGSSSGDDDSADEEEAVGHIYQRHFRVGGELKELESTVVEDDDSDTALRREWVEIRSTAPGTEDVVVERDLHPGQWSSEEISQVERRHALTVVAGPLDDEFLAEVSDEVDFDVDEAGARLDKLSESAEDASDDEVEELIAELVELGDATTKAAGHLTGLRFAATSDMLGGRVIVPTGAARVWARPRVLITTFGAGEEDGDDSMSQISLDLRMNGVDVYAPPGASPALATDLQATRGMLDGYIEYELLRQTTEQSDVISTTALMSRVHEKDIDVHVLVSPEAPWLEEVEDLPEYSRRHIDEALSAQRHVIIPERAVELDGRDRWGWWELDPEDGELLAVMESGQHQAATEYSVVLNRIALNEHLAMALGMTTGSTATMFAASTVMLRHWELTDQAIDEMEEILEAVRCAACFSGIEAGASGEVSVEVSGHAGCIEKSIKESASVGVEAKATLSYCENYQKGFECITSRILASLRDEEPESLAGVDIDAGVDVDITARINCEDFVDDG